MSRLFLASQDFGNHADKLSEMVGDNRRSLVVFNARDYKENKEIDQQRELFDNVNLEFRELDLRDYFGQAERLKNFVDEYKPGLVVLLGGNTFLLRRALAQSGLDEILKHDTKQDKYVLAGHSAGSIVVGPGLEGFEVMDQPELVLPGYQPEVIWSGLELTDTRVIPHANSAKYAHAAASREKLFKERSLRYIVLNDEDVFVVNGDEREVLR